MLIEHISPVAGDEFAPIFVALELSRSKWLVGVGTSQKWGFAAMKESAPKSSYG